MKISVIIASRNRGQNLRGTLEALYNQNFTKSDYEVIISDDNSSDETQLLLNDYRYKLQLKYVFSNLPKPHTWNASIPRNLGALVADPMSIAYYFVDSDVILPIDAIANVAEDLEKNSDRVIIGPYDFYNEGNETIRNSDVRNLKFEEVSVDQTFNTVHDGLAGFGGNIVIPKDIFLRVGGYDPQTFIGLEDGELGIRLWKMGVNFSYDARNRGKHQWHESPPDRFPPDMPDHIDKLNLKHFGTKKPDYGIIEISRETYAKWGMEEPWNPPIEWGMERKNEES